MDQRLLGRKTQVTSVHPEIQIQSIWEALLSVTAPPILYPKGTKHCLEPSSGFFFSFACFSTFILIDPCYLYSSLPIACDTEPYS